MNIIFFEANHDEETLQVHRARRLVYSGMANGATGELFGEDATAEGLKSEIRIAPGCRLISAMGHGVTRRFFGHRNQIVTDISDTRSLESYLKFRVLHLYSCLTAYRLGPELIEKGLHAFIGYDARVALASSPEIEQIFVAVSLAIDQSILDDDSELQTFEKAKQAHEQGLSELTASPHVKPDDIAAFEQNFNALKGPWIDSGLYGRYQRATQS